MRDLNAYHPRLYLATLALVHVIIIFLSAKHTFSVQCGIYESRILELWHDPHFRFVMQLKQLQSWKNDRDASKPVMPHFNLPRNSTRNIIIYVLSLYQGNIDSRKNLEQKLIF